MGQDVVGQNFVGQDVVGAIFLGQEVSGAGGSGAGSRESMNIAMWLTVIAAAADYCSAEALLRLSSISSQLCISSEDLEN